MDDRGKTVACREAKSAARPCVASAAEPLWGVGAVGHLRSRLAGRTGREAVSDRDDRRCDEPAAGAVCAERFNRGEHAAAAELCGEQWAAAGILYGQGEPVSNGRKTEARRARGGQRLCGNAAHANRTCAAGTGNCVDPGTLGAGEGKSGKEFRNSSGSASEGYACGWSENAGAGQ